MPSRCLRAAKKPHQLYHGDYLDMQRAKWLLWTRAAFWIIQCRREAAARLPRVEEESRSNGSTKRAPVFLDQATLWKENISNLIILLANSSRC